MATPGAMSLRENNCEKSMKMVLSAWQGTQVGWCAATAFRSNFERMAERCYNPEVPHGPSATTVELRGIPPRKSASVPARLAALLFEIGRGPDVRTRSGQVAQVVERSPEKAGVGGSTPSLATNIPKNLAEIWFTRRRIGTALKRL
jgi:hypothetical protein